MEKNWKFFRGYADPINVEENFRNKKYVGINREYHSFYPGLKDRRDDSSDHIINCCVVTFVSLSILITIALRIFHVW